MSERILSGGLKTGKDGSTIFGERTAVEVFFAEDVALVAADV